MESLALLARPISSRRLDLPFGGGGGKSGSNAHLKCDLKEKREERGGEGDALFFASIAVLTCCTRK